MNEEKEHSQVTTIATSSKDSVSRQFYGVSYGTSGGFSCNNHDYHPQFDTLNHHLETLTLQDIRLIEPAVSSLLPYGIAVASSKIPKQGLLWFPILGKGFSSLSTRDWDNCFKAMLVMMDMLPIHPSDGDSPVKNLSMQTIRVIFEQALVEHFSQQGIEFNPQTEQYHGLINDNDGPKIPRSLLNLVLYIQKRFSPIQRDEKNIYKVSRGIEVLGSLLYLQDHGWEVTELVSELLKLDDSVLRQCQDLYEVLACIHLLKLDNGFRDIGKTLNAVMLLSLQYVDRYKRGDNLTELLQATLETIRENSETSVPQNLVYTRCFGVEWEWAGIFLLSVIARIKENAAIIQHKAESIAIEKYPGIERMQWSHHW